MELARVRARLCEAQERESAFELQLSMAEHRQKDMRTHIANAEKQLVQVANDLRQCGAAVPPSEDPNDQLLFDSFREV